LLGRLARARRRRRRRSVPVSAATVAAATGERERRGDHGRREKPETTERTHVLPHLHPSEAGPLVRVAA
jgi:hypothetical protein